MSVSVPPHHPTAGELDAARFIKLPSGANDLNDLLRLAHQADLQGMPNEAINLLRAALLIVPDEARIYEALGNVYRNLKRSSDAAACFSEAHRLKSAAPKR